MKYKWKLEITKLPDSFDRTLSCWYINNEKGLIAALVYDANFINYISDLEAFVANVQDLGLITKEHFGLHKLAKNVGLKIN